MAVINKSAPQPPKQATDVAPFGGIRDGEGGSGSFPGMYTAELIAILRGGEKIHIVTPLPENYQFQLSTSFDNPFNQPLASLTGSQTADRISTGVTAVTGQSSISKWMSGAVWTGGSLFEVNVPFVIQAFSDTKEEIVKTMRDMLKLVAPSEQTGGLLRAPGPTMSSSFGTASAGDDITIRVGKFFTMRPCLIESVECDFDTQMDVDNQSPLSATITVSAKSFWTTTKEDLDKYFRIPKG